jgi:hypothetical protein
MPQLPLPLPRSVEASPHDRRFDGLGFCLGGVTSGLDELIVMGMHSGTQGAVLVRKRGAQNARRAGGAPRAAEHWPKFDEFSNEFCLPSRMRTCRNDGRRKDSLTVERVWFAFGAENSFGPRMLFVRSGFVHRV